MAEQAVNGNYKYNRKRFLSTALQVAKRLDLGTADQGQCDPDLVFLAKALASVNLSALSQQWLFFSGCLQWWL